MNEDQNDVVKNLPSRVSRLEASVERIESDIQSMIKAVDRMASRISEGQKAPWQTLIAGAGVLILIIGGLAQGYVRDQHRVERDLTALTDRVLVHFEQPAHTGIEQRVIAIDHSIEKFEEHLATRFHELDDKLQKEIRAQDGSSETRHKTMRDLLDRTDDKIQNEIRALSELVDAKLAAFAVGK